MCAPLWNHHNTPDLLYLRIIRRTDAVQVSCDLKHHHKWVISFVSLIRFVTLLYTSAKNRGSSCEQARIKWSKNVQAGGNPGRKWKGTFVVLQIKRCCCFVLFCFFLNHCYWGESWHLLKTSIQPVQCNRISAETTKSFSRLVTGCSQSVSSQELQHRHQHIVRITYVDRQR